MDDPTKQSQPDDTLKACETQRDEYLAGWKRAAADLINYKKEEYRRVEEVSGYACTKILKDILPVLDSFNLALAAVKGNESAEKGLLMIKGQIDDFLKKQSVERIKASPGDSLDLNLHEPVLEVEATDNPQFSGKILEELSPGYMLNGRVIRAVKVKVAK